MSAHDKVVPLRPAPAKSIQTEQASAPAYAPGLHPEAIGGLVGHYPGILTTEMRALLQGMSGMTARELGTIDFTGRWHQKEPIDVLRPSLTLAIDRKGRRWLAETARAEGLPGPVWCVLPEPAVALWVSDDLQGFIDAVAEEARDGSLSRWVQRLDFKGQAVWANRHTLAQESQRQCAHDPKLRAWLAALPSDARIYDLRGSSTVRGWPYGLLGHDGKFYRCGSLPVFAVAGLPYVNRWKRHLAHVAASGEILWPAAASHRDTAWQSQNASTGGNAGRSISTTEHPRRRAA